MVSILTHLLILLFFTAVAQCLPLEAKETVEALVSGNLSIGLHTPSKQAIDGGVATISTISSVATSSDVVSSAASTILLSKVRTPDILSTKSTLLIGVSSGESRNTTGSLGYLTPSVTSTRSLLSSATFVLAGTSTRSVAPQISNSSGALSTGLQLSLQVSSPPLQGSVDSPSSSSPTFSRFNESMTSISSIVLQPLESELSKSTSSILLLSTARRTESRSTPTSSGFVMQSLPPISDTPSSTMTDLPPGISLLTLQKSFVGNKWIVTSVAGSSAEETGLAINVDDGGPPVLLFHWPKISNLFQLHVPKLHIPCVRLILGLKIGSCPPDSTRGSSNGGGGGGSGPNKSGKPKSNEPTSTGSTESECSTAPATITSVGCATAGSSTLCTTKIILSTPARGCTARNTATTTTSCAASTVISSSTMCCTSTTVNAGSTVCAFPTLAVIGQYQPFFDIKYAAGPGEAGISSAVWGFMSLNPISSPAASAVTNSSESAQGLNGLGKTEDTASTPSSKVSNDSSQLSAIASNIGALLLGGVSSKTTETKSTPPTATPTPTPKTTPKAATPTPTPGPSPTTLTKGADNNMPAPTAGPNSPDATPDITPPKIHLTTYSTCTPSDPFDLCDN